jgi:hypothetical protein
VNPVRFIGPVEHKIWHAKSHVEGLRGDEVQIWRTSRDMLRPNDLSGIIYLVERYLLTVTSEAVFNLRNVIVEFGADMDSI